MLRAAHYVLLAALALACERPALRLTARDVVEDLLALVRELDQQDGRVRLWFDVCPGSG